MRQPTLSPDLTSRPARAVLFAAFERRRLRLASGLALFAYVGLHLVNHALGLVSLQLAEGGLRLSIAVWHSLPGSVMLYGAAAIHVAMAFDSLFRRRTLKLPAIEWVRMVMGFGMPVLLIGHVIATRAAFEIFGLDPVYARVIRGIWSSGNEWLQLGLLAPGWIHGCLGLHIAFGHRRGYRRAFWVSYAAALLLPVLAAIGFWTMSRELTQPPPVASLQGPAQQLLRQSPTSQAGRVETADAIAALRRNALTGYGTLLLLVVVARIVRRQWERQRRSLITVELAQRRVELPRGWSILEGLRSQGVPHASACGGRARCSTCRVRVLEGQRDCPPATGEEARLLERLGAAADVRLACQLRPSGNLRIEPLMRAGVKTDRDFSRPMLTDLNTRLAGTRTSDRATEAEFDALVLRLGVSTETAPGPGCLNSDVWLALQSLIRIGDQLAASSGGRVAQLGENHLLLTFDTRALDSESSLEIVRRAEASIDRLCSRTLTGMASPVQFTMHVHRGPVFLASLTIDDSRLAVVMGEAVIELRQFAGSDGTANAGAVESGTQSSSPAATLPQRAVTRLTPQAEAWLTQSSLA